MNLYPYKVVIVIPVYEDIEAISLLFKELEHLYHRDVYVVAVDDGSVRQPLKIENLEDAGVEGAVLKLRRNVGHQRAIAIGLGYISSHICAEHQVVVMDSDGEDVPSTIPDLLKKLKSEEIDVVVAQRKSRV